MATTTMLVAVVKVAFESMGAAFNLAPGASNTSPNKAAIVEKASLPLSITWSDDL